ncbi:unnamed protein product [Prunus armeniaca]
MPSRASGRTSARSGRKTPEAVCCLAICTFSAGKGCPGRARRSKARQIWKLLNRKKFANMQITTLISTLTNNLHQFQEFSSSFDCNGKYPFHIDTVDQYDSDASLNDISVEEWDE